MWTNEHTESCFQTIDSLLDNGEGEEAMDVFHLLAVGVWTGRQLPAMPHGISNERCFAWVVGTILLHGLVRGLDVETLPKVDADEDG